ncbi:E3 ubiquitin-protein ligase RNF152-like [Megalops cyprinoides]|uniref:E3 ubiquitin-protein ligase RNF152-like n=1 Tax=Megalops cyprinoides TaxID=118141 RepID=UPI0018655416|nr:E3 ubiquitin-protein ligase RNF152-like [Megalops cyprinoides]
MRSPRPSCRPTPAAIIGAGAGRSASQGFLLSLPSGTLQFVRHLRAAQMASAEWRLSSNCCLFHGDAPRDPRREKQLLQAREKVLSASAQAAENEMAEANLAARGGDGVATAIFPYEEYECKICYNYYDLDRRAPKILECLHTFCEECLNTLHLREDRPWRIGCPLCRHRTPVPEYRIQNLPNNTNVIQAFPLYIEADPLPQDSLPPYPPPLHPALTALRREEATGAAAGASPNQATQSVPVSVATTASYDSAPYESCQNCKRVALTTCCVFAIFGLLSMIVLLFIGLIFMHNFKI